MPLRRAWFCSRRARTRAPSSSPIKSGGVCPKAAEVLEKAEADALGYLDFPCEHHVSLRTKNVQERTDRELKRRSRVIQVFPSRK